MAIKLIIDINDGANRNLVVIKARYRLLDKFQASEDIIAEYEGEILELELILNLFFST